MTSEGVSSTSASNSNVLLYNDVYIVSRHRQTKTRTSDSSVRKNSAVQRPHASIGKLPHVSLLTNGHVYHITSELARHKRRYLQASTGGGMNCRIQLKIENASTSTTTTPTSSDTVYNFSYVGRTCYSHAHVRMYAEFLVRRMYHYGLFGATCHTFVARLFTMITDVRSLPIRTVLRRSSQKGTLADMVARGERLRSPEVCPREQGWKLRGALGRVFKLQYVVMLSDWWRSDHCFPRICPRSLLEDDGGNTKLQGSRYPAGTFVHRPSPPVLSSSVADAATMSSWVSRKQRRILSPITSTPGFAVFDNLSIYELQLMYVS